MPRPAKTIAASLPLIILTSRALLSRQSGSDQFPAVEEALRQLARTAPNAVLAFLDDQASLRPWGLEAVNPHRPEEIRCLIEQLESRLAGGPPSMVWLIGAPSVIPFFRLSNPADDTDSEVLADIPYACQGTELYRPVRAVCRLPILGQGAAVAEAIRLQVERRSSMAWRGDAAATGFSASVWREAARDVYSLLDQSGNLRMSPPWGARDYHRLCQATARLRYFNLHGKPDGAIWYGQRDPQMPADYTDFPIALRASDISVTEAQGAVIASEACYGASLEPGSITNKLLRLGAAVYLGSTAMAYGAIAVPVSGADLLFKEFFTRLLAGATAGEAFSLAQLAFARQMMNDQGFLDAEDQKTLLSFVLFGNPTFSLQPAAAASAAIKLQAQAWANLSVVCAHGIPDVRPLPNGTSLLAELEAMASAIFLEDTLPPAQRQENCKHYSQYAQQHLSTGGKKVVVIRQLLPTGATRLAKFTVSANRIVKTSVSR